MIQVDFHTRVADKLGYTCRLLRKAYRAGSRVVVAGAPPTLGALDKLLWTFDPGEFVPHVRRNASTSAPRFAGTPIWLIETGTEPPHHEVLVNIGAEVMPGFESFKRVIELISLEPEDVQAGRRRWKHYADRGYKLEHHEVAS